MTTTERDTECPPDIGPLEWKALPTGETSSPLTGVLDYDDAQGTITALVAISGVEDKVGDVIVPGSLGTAVKRLKPKGVLDHNWARKVSKLVYSAELMPGDTRLPPETPDGQPWPANAGGLLVKAQYNLDKEDGRDAYSDAKFYGPDECFSIGYKVRPGGARIRNGKRHLHDYDIYEWSQVLHGAHPLAHLTGVKSLLTPETDGGQWYDAPRSGVTAVEGIETKVRYVHDAKFWKLPTGTPIKPGMRPAGVTQSVRGDVGTDSATTETLPAGHDAAATAAAHLGERMAELKDSDNDLPGDIHGGAAKIASANLLAQFTRPGADVHASPDAQIAAVNNGNVWVIVDTANGSSLPSLPNDVAPEQVDQALSEIAKTGIPWDDIAARKKRWADPATKREDQQAVQAIIAKHSHAAALGTALGATPGSGGQSADAMQARQDADWAAQNGERDELADALTRMGLSRDQDPHDVAASLLVLPTEVAQQRLDRIEQAANPAAAAGRTAQPPSKPAGGSTEPGAPAAPTTPGQPATAPSAPAADARKLGAPVAVTPPDSLGTPAGDYPTVNAGDARTGDVVMFTPSDGGEITEVAPARGGLVTITYTGVTGKPATRNPKLATALPLLNAGDNTTQGGGPPGPDKPTAGAEANPMGQVSNDAAAAARERLASRFPHPGDRHIVEAHGKERAAADEAAKPYVPTGNMNNVGALSDDQLHAEHAAATARHAQARAANLPKTSTSYSDSKMAAKVFGDEKRKRGLDKPAPAAAEAKPADAVQVPTDTADAAAKIRDEALGITEDPDGVIEVTQEVADRQDRVTALLDAGDTDLGHKTDAALKTDQTDLTDELKLQIELARRDAEHKRATADAKAASKPKEAAPEPRGRPGVAGAAEDLGDLLNAKTTDLEAVKVAGDRLVKLLRRVPADSNAFNDLHKVIGDGDIHAAVTAGTLKPGMLFAAAGGLREERRVRRNEGAKKRRVAKRIETDRIKSLLGSVEAELRRRDSIGKPDAYDAHRARMGDVKPGAADRTGPPADSPERRAARQASTTARDTGRDDLTPARRGQLVRAAEKYAAQYGGPDSPTPGADSVARYIVEGHLPDASRAEWSWLANYIESHPDLLTRKPDTATAKDTRPLSERSAEASGHAKAARAAFDAGHHDEATAHLDKARAVAPERNHLWSKIGDHIAANRDAPKPSPVDEARKAEFDKATAEDFPADTTVRVYPDWDRDHHSDVSYEATALRRARNGYVTIREPEGTTVDVLPRQLEGAGAQSEHGDTHGSAGSNGAAVVPGVPTGRVREAARPEQVLPATGGPGGPGDRTSGRRDSGDRPPGGDVQPESGTPDQVPAGGDGASDAGNADEPTAPGLAGQRRATPGDTGPEHSPPAADVSGPGVSGSDRGVPHAAGTGDAGTAGQPGDHGTGGDAGTAAPADAGLAQPKADPGQLDAIPDTGESFRPQGMDDLAPAGKRAKLDANIAALRTLRKLQEERRSATPDEQTVLAHWAGWGGLPEVFDTLHPEYAKDREIVRGLLNDDEWNAAKHNTLNAHYTDATAVAAMWQALEDLGFDGGRVLEPGSGSGNFIGLAPQHLDIDMVGVELDPTTAAISKALYPNATIRNESFAKTRIPTGHFDAVVGNVPFGKFALTDRVHNPAGDSIHNHFIGKSLDLTKPGGIVAVLTSRYTLDSKNSAARKRLAEKGDLIGAVRLPTGSHQRASGTSVIEDVLIFRRRDPGAAPATSQDWINSSDREIDGHTVGVSNYFTAHPEQILGELHAEKGQYGTGSIIVRGDKSMADLPDALARVVATAKESNLTASPRLADTGALVDPDLSRHEGHIGVDSHGDFTQALGGASVPYAVPDTQKEELRGLIGMRDTLSALLTAEAGSVSNTPEIKELRADLNTQYDAYVKRYGPINRYKLAVNGRRNAPPQGGFRNDPMSAIVRALESYDPETGKGTKTSIFTKRSVAPREIPTTADNPKDALALSMDTYGRVDLPAIAKMLGTDEAGARRGLGDMVFEQPPLSDAELNAAITSDAEERGLLGDPEVHVDEIDLSSVGESVRSEGALETSAAYLSGNVRRKLVAARAAAVHDKRFRHNVKALEAVIPEELGAAEIDGRLGSAWIGASDVKAFLEHLLDNKNAGVQVSTSGGGVWSVIAPTHGSAATEVWGTNRKSVGDLVSALLEQKPIRVADTIDGKSYPNLDDTLAAQAKADEISERFSEWLWEDPERARRLQAVYNDRFNAIVLRSYDGTTRAFPGMADSFDPGAHQVAAVERIVSEPAAMLAHVVGAGKTAEMAMGAAELKRLGLANKPAIVVPNHMLEQFSREFLEIYPQAKILAASTKDLEGDKRREFVARAATGDWDAVILTQTAFEAIPMSLEQQKAYIDRELATMRAQLEALQSSDASGKAHDNTLKKMEASLTRAREAMEKKMGKDKDAGVSFEQTGIDHVMVDEAHMFSNLRTPSAIQGAAIDGSDRATDLHMKLEHLRATSRSGKVATFATGTPIRNSITQMYVMQRYLRPDLLEQAGIHTFDQWAGTFGQTVDEMELKPEGIGFRQTTRFSKFRNVPELVRLFHVFADVKSAEDLKLPTPKLTTGAVQNAVVQPSDELRAFVKELGERAERVRGKTPDMRPGAKGGLVEDNMLLITMDGRKAALSMELVGGQYAPGKIERAADEIYKRYLVNKDRPVPKDPKHPESGDDPPPGGMQLVFLDMGTPSADSRVEQREEFTEGSAQHWNAYAKLRDELAARGLDPKKVQFIHEAKSDVQKAAMFAAARNGAISVLIGSSEKMGVGTNVQRRAVALHHLDAPWRPSDVEQRDGRIMRRGNTNAEVEILRYVTEGSFDAYMWQTLARKQKFIEQIMRGNLDAREIEDVGDTALSYDEVKALATGNLDLMAKAKADTAVAKLSKLERVHKRTQTNLGKDVTAFTARAGEADVEAEGLDASIARRTDTGGEAFTAKVGGATYDKRTEAAEEIKDRIKRIINNNRYAYRTHEAEPVAQIGGHTLMVRAYDGVGQRQMVELTFKGVPGVITTMNEGELNQTGVGLVTRAENNLFMMESRRDRARARAVHLRSEVVKMQPRIGLPFGKAAELAAAREDSLRLEAKLHAAGVNTAAPVGPKVDEGLVTARAKATRQVTNLGRSTYNKDERTRLAKFANPSASGKAWASSDGDLGAMGTGSDFTVFATSSGDLLWRPETPAGQVPSVTDPAGLLRDLQDLGIPLTGHEQATRWRAPYLQHSYNTPHAEREKQQDAAEAVARKQEDADKAAMAAVWARHTTTADAPKLAPIDEAKSRAAQAARDARGDTEKLLKRFVNAGKRIPTAASDDGTIGMVTDTSGMPVFLATGNGMLLNGRPDLQGPFDDPTAVANDIAALGIPLGDREARMNRWAEQGRQRADTAAVVAVFVKHKVSDEETSLGTISAADLARVAEIKALAKADTADPEDVTDAGQETYADTVAADLRYFMDAGGVLHKVAVCAGCGTDVPSPVFNPPGNIPCPGCGKVAAPMATVG